MFSLKIWLTLYREFGSLLHDLVPQQSRGDRPFLLVPTGHWFWNGPRAAGVLQGWLQNPVHPGVWRRALERWWRPAPAASAHGAGLTRKTPKCTAVVLPGCSAVGGRGRAAGDTAKGWGSLGPPDLATTCGQGFVHGHWDRHEGWRHLLCSTTN